MKTQNIFIILITMLLCSGCAKHGTSMKVVVSGDEVIGRLVEDTGDYYIVETQDRFQTEKKGKYVENWKASDGKGVIYMWDYGTEKAYSKPDTDSPVAFELLYERGYVPETYECKGYRNGWYEVELNGAKAYVKDDNVIWDAIDSF